MVRSRRLIADTRVARTPLSLSPQGTRIFPGLSTTSPVIAPLFPPPDAYFLPLFHSCRSVFYYSSQQTFPDPFAYWRKVLEISFRPHWLFCYQIRVIVEKFGSVHKMSGVSSCTTEEFIDTHSLGKITFFIHSLVAKGGGM